MYVYVGGGVDDVVGVVFGVVFGGMFFFGCGYLVVVVVGNIDV